VLFIGDDWAEDHHDLEIEDQDGHRLARARLPEGLEGITRLHALVAEHAPAVWADLPPEQVAGQVVVGIETDRDPWVTALRAAGYQVFAINPLSAARYRQRHSTSGAKSDAGDAHVLAEIVRLDRDHHRAVAGDSDLADAIKLLARAHQSAVWERTRQVLRMRSTLLEIGLRVRPHPARGVQAGLERGLGDQLGGVADIGRRQPLARGNEHPRIDVDRARCPPQHAATTPSEPARPVARSGARSRSGHGAKRHRRDH